jgi:hypothetical protein
MPLSHPYPRNFHCGLEVLIKAFEREVLAKGIVEESRKGKTAE